MNETLHQVFDIFLKTSAAAFTLIITCKIVWVTYEIVWPYILGRPRDLHKLAGSNWAVVTGATDGIGKAYAFELARKKFNLVLISRNQTRLDSTAREIDEKFPELQVKTIAFDFTNTDLDEYERKIFSVLDNMEVGLLVNNVGMTYEYPEVLHKVHGGLKKISDVVLVNTLPVTLLTARLLKQMTQRNRGIIVNISSVAGYHPTTYWAVYSTVKEYVRWFGLCLRKEYSNTRIHIQTICPGLVITKMSKVIQDLPSLFAVTPETFARSAVGTIGLIDETTGCLFHQLQSTAVFRLSPKFLVDWGIRRNGEKTRARAIEKLESQQPGSSQHCNDDDHVPLVE